jgi:glycerol-3-phosphate dehydrogenase (NAD(P)+)
MRSERRGYAEVSRIDRIAIIGAGAWGTTLALVAARAGRQVTLVAHRATLASHLAIHRVHPTSLPGITLPDLVEVTIDLASALRPADAVIVAVPAQSLRGALTPHAEELRDKLLISAVKGLELGTLLRPTQVLAELMGNGHPRALCALSGPNLASEVAQGKPTTTVIASESRGIAAAVQRALTSSTFRIYVTDDVTGAEMGGALKNIIAIGAGIGDGMQAGDNAKAAFLTRGIAEIARLGVACGAEALTFAGLTGIGDVIATCASPLSRNHRVGLALAQGKALPDILHSMGEVAEGVPTTKAAHLLGQNLGVELPIIDQMYEVLFNGKPPLAAIETLMEREPKREDADRGGRHPAGQ